MTGRGNRIAIVAEPLGRESGIAVRSAQRGHAKADKNRDTTKSLADLGASRIAALKPDTNSTDSGDVGCAVPTILSAIATISRVKQRVGAFDQTRIMAIIDDEVYSVRTGRH